MIIKKLAAVNENIAVVGDDAQSIYAFRGANIKNILGFQKDFPEVKTFKLEQNYRSTKTIVNAASSIIEKNKDQIKKKVWTDNELGERIRVFKALTDNEEGKMVASAIFQDKMNNQALNKDFAILYRTNMQSRSMEEALRKLNIPYKIYGGLSFYQRKEVKDLLGYYRLVLNPNDEEALKRVINYPTRGIGKTTMEKIALVADQHKVSLWQVMEQVNQIGFKNMSAVEDFVTMIKSFRVMLDRNAYDVAMHIAKQSGVLKSLYEDKTEEYINCILPINILYVYPEDCNFKTDKEKSDDNYVILGSFFCSKNYCKNNIFNSNKFRDYVNNCIVNDEKIDKRIFYLDDNYDSYINDILKYLSKIKNFN
jgi:DNA helicase-2/ATP-dependent DNA helicase PcrA